MNRLLVPFLLFLTMISTIQGHTHYGGATGYSGRVGGGGYAGGGSANIIGPSEPGITIQGPGSQTNLIGPDGSHIIAKEIGGTIISPPKQGGIIQSSVSPGYISGGRSPGNYYGSYPSSGSAGYQTQGGYTSGYQKAAEIYPPKSYISGSKGYSGGSGYGRGSGCSEGCGNTGQVYPGGRGSGIEGQVQPGGRGSGLEGQWQPDHREKQFNDGLYRGEGAYQGRFTSQQGSSGAQHDALGGQQQDFGTFGFGASGGAASAAYSGSYSGSRVASGGAGSAAYSGSYSGSGGSGRLGEGNCCQGRK